MCGFGGMEGGSASFGRFEGAGWEERFAVDCLESLAGVSSLLAAQGPAWGYLIGVGGICSAASVRRRMKAHIDTRCLLVEASLWGAVVTIAGVLWVI
jgi:hypothetical protein